MFDRSDLKTFDPEIYASIQAEVVRQNTGIELIASENFTTPAVMQAQGSVMTNKYAEGYPGKRWYRGCENVDKAEALAIERAMDLFGAEYANVQPHSGSGANMAVYFAAIQPGDTVMAMDLAHGGHLTHGHSMNFSGRLYNIVSYGVDKETEQLNYDELRKIALESKPKMIIAGASAYPRTLDFEKFAAIAKEVGAILFVDMAHIAGLVAAGEHPSPVPHADFVTTTTHKTLRGPRGGLILCKEKYAKAIDSNVFPGLQGGPLMHVIAAKAVALKAAASAEFAADQKQVLKNAQIMAQELAAGGLRIVSGGTDNHLMLVDLSAKDVSGKDVAIMLDKAGITVNKNMIPFDTRSPFQTSGIRIGTPAVTARGMKEPEMKEIASFITQIIDENGSDSVIAQVKAKVEYLAGRFPLYPEYEEA